MNAFLMASTHAPGRPTSPHSSVVASFDGPSHRGPGCDPQRACGLPKIDVDACRREDKHRPCCEALACGLLCPCGSNSGKKWWHRVCSTIVRTWRAGKDRGGQSKNSRNILGLKPVGRPHALSNIRASFESWLCCEWPSGGK